MQSALGFYEIPTKNAYLAYGRVTEGGKKKSPNVANTQAELAILFQFFCNIFFHAVAVFPLGFNKAILARSLIL